MTTEFKFPDVGEGITEGELLKWLVAEGETVRQDQPLAEVETDKAVVELPSPVSGTILKLRAKPGDKITVGQILVSIGQAGEKPEANQQSIQKETEAKKPVSKPMDFSKPVQTPPVLAQAEQIRAMPHTRKLARMLGLDIRNVPATGPGGRITDQDVQRFKERKETPSPAFVASKKGGEPAQAKHGTEERIALRGIRKAIAENVARAFRTTVPVTLMEEVDVSDLWNMREKEKTKLQEHGVHLTFLPFIIKACVLALQKFPYFNASIDDEKAEIVLKHYFHIGIAVDTEDGLMVPVIRNADQKTIVELAIEIQELAKSARERRISLDDLKGSSFSITNYGSLGGRFGTPIINYPNVAVLGLGRIAERPIVKNGQIVISKTLPVSLTFDHRIVDGAQAAAFIDEILKHLQDPGLLLVDSL